MSSINTRPFISEPAETGAIFSLYQRPEWRNVDFGRRFQSNFSLLGKNIILSQPRGYAELADVKQSIALNHRVISEVLLKILADINWEALDHEKIAQSLTPFHPFHPVAEALSLIKMDFDQLLNERDISEKQLRESRERYKNILASIEEGYYELDIDGNLTFYNAALKRMLGYTDKELAVINYLRVADESNAEDIYKTFSTVFKTRKPAKALDWRLRRKDGAKIYIEASVSAITNEAGQVRGFRGIIRDITEKVEARIEKEKLEKRLQQSQKMEAVGTLAGGVAHDLNNILSGIVSYPDLLLMKIPADSSLRKSIETIKRSGERASAVVQDLLTLAQKGLPESRIENLNPIVEEYLSSPEHKRLMHEHPNVRVETSLDDNLLNIPASSIHILKIIMNLVANAAEAMPTGGKISLSSENVYIAPADNTYPELREGEYVKLVVADEGIGISPKDQERIFEPFYTKKIMGRSGSGLGMAMVWGAVRGHSGHIDVQSILQKGTRISIFLPACRAEIAASDMDQSIDHLAGNGESVIVVDDVAEQRELADQMLTRLGYRVIVFPSGEAGVAYLKDHPADLVILDMIMEPGMDGLDTYKAILELHPSQKAIIATGFATSNRIQAAEAIGVKQCVKKPFLMADLARAVRAELDASRAGKENPGKKFEF